MRGVRESPTPGSQSPSSTFRRNSGGSLRAGEAAPSGGRDLFVEADHRRIGFLARLLGLESGEPLRSEVVRVLLLDALQPLGALGGLGLVDLYAADLE